MSCIVARSCTAVPEPDIEREGTPVSRSLAAFRDTPAYVLLGDPGSGKTTSFEAEGRALGEDACLVTARDFLTLEPDAHPEWRGKTLFIDGLDEVRAGGRDARTPLDALRRRLDALAKPRFRLSCREADWLGANDRTHLSRVSQNAGLVVLRLDPLSDDDIQRILSARNGIDDPCAFAEAAKERGVAGLLANPQCLNMLADVVAGGDGWPGSRLELFEEACRRMLREQNEEHLAAAERSSLPAVVPDDLLYAAGRLCAVLLLSGSAGYALGTRWEDNDYPALDRCGSEYAVLGRQVLATTLFTSGHRRCRPVHRHIAEFLGARHLAGLVDNRTRNGDGRRGIPARRVVAMMTGYDATIVTALRGLSAWLAVHSNQARADLADRDPIGVGLYGDVSQFLPDQQRRLFASLQRQASRLEPTSRTASAFKALASPAMESAFGDLLAVSRPGEDEQLTARFVLSVLARGTPLPSLSEVLLAVVRNPAWHPVVNERALIAFIHNTPNSQEKTAELRRLLTDVRRGRVSDPHHELLGILLMELYPDAVTPSHVWNHFLASALEQGPRRYYVFWRQAFGSRSTNSQVAEHLDTLATRAESMASAVHSPMLTGLTDLLANLLVRGLEAYGDRLDTRRLYDWLGVGLLSPAGDSSTSDGASRIRSWLQRRPGVQKAVFAEGVNRCGKSDEEPVAVCASEVWRRLYGSTLPPDFGLWCLDRAVAATDARIAKYFLERSFGAVTERSNDDGLSLKLLIERARAHPTLATIFAELSVCPLDAQYAERQARRRHRTQSEEERHLRHARWIDHVRSNEDALRANRVSPHLLHQIAAAYLGALAEAEGHDPLARLASVFRNDGRLVALALQALRGAIRRDDLPDVDEVVRLRDGSQQHYLAWPVLAGLSEMHRAAPQEPLHLDDAQLRIALAFRYCGTANDDPAWYRQALVSRSRTVAEVLMQTARAEIRNGRPHVVGLYELAYDGSHADVAGMACLPLLEAFPVRAAAGEMNDLQYLLWAALRHGDRQALVDLVRRKLSCRSMSVAQRGRWLAAVVIISPGTYLDALEGFADGRGERMQHVMSFFDYHSREWYPGDELGTGALRLLVRLAGREFEPLVASGLVTPRVSAAEGVRWMISRLATSASEDASRALEALAADPVLFRWREELLSAADRQRAVRRDTTYRHPDIEEVCRTLDDGPPANAADLAALTADRLDELGVGIRNDNANGWRPFWNEDERRHPETPKHEESCRDVLLKELRHWLPGDMDVQPEGRYANDKRADLRIAYRDFHIPVEIKKNGHPRLWSALRDQLMAQYTRDPATDGYGIYLVLWFGEIQGCRMPPPATGQSPAGPDTLRKRLEEELTPEEARKISVCVIDVSAPPTRGR